jgi:hypothetical protein
MLLDLNVLNKTKESNPLLRITHIQWQKRSIYISIILMQVSVPAEDGP